MTTPSSTTHSPLSIRAPEIVCKHPESASSTSESPPAFLPWSPLLCTCISANDISANESITQDLRCLYEQHQQGQTSQKCAWFIQAKRAQENYLMRKHESEIKSKLKQEAKESLKQKEEARIAAKRAEGYTCRRCKHSAKFDSNTKLHEHIRTRHAKKPKSKPAQQSVEHVASPPTPPASSPPSSPQSVTSSPPTSPKLVAESPATPTPSELSPTSSVATPRKPISWAEIASRPVAPKPSRLPIATPKSVCKPLENASIACPPTPPRTPTPSRPYLTVDDLFRMFAGKPSPFGLQRHQMRSFSPRGPGKCSPVSKCGPIQSRITSYFHAAASPASKSAKSEAFASTHARGTVPRQFSASASPTSFPSRFPMVSRPSPVCRHCQGRSATYWPTGWAMPTAARAGNNEIPKGMRYWRFASLHPTLGKY
ncbi:hypothetical protein G7Y79_00062g093650 [Physcia stellaris]|nr:hypothetical protein G7Y79_00062g093650 [Physcia stellaris]